MNLGDVLIAEGGLTFAESLSLGNPSKTITIAAGANLNVYDLNVTNPIVRNITHDGRPARFRRRDEGHQCLQRRRSS